MVRVTVEPQTTNAGGRRVFQALRATFTPNDRRLVLVLRDGSMCIELQGDWSLEVRDSQVMAHSIAEAERIHDGSSLVLMSH